MLSREKPERPVSRACARSAIKFQDSEGFALGTPAAVAVWAGADAAGVLRRGVPGVACFVAVRGCGAFTDGATEMAVALACTGTIAFLADFAAAFLAATFSSAARFFAFAASVFS